jgi:8-oxo-dGTP diphosphatase
MLSFGEKIDGVAYKDLPCARGIFQNEKGEFGFVNVNGQYFLVGGGIEEGETPEQAVVREFREEIGAEIKIIRKIGEAEDYLFGKKEEAYFRKIQTFFVVEIIGDIKGGIEDNHKLVWATIDSAETFILQKSQAWAIRQI